MARICLSPMTTHGSGTGVSSVSPEPCRATPQGGSRDPEPKVAPEPACQSLRLALHARAPSWFLKKPFSLICFCANNCPFLPQADLVGDGAIHFGGWWVCRCEATLWPGSPDAPRWRQPQARAQAFRGPRGGCGPSPFRVLKVTVFVGFSVSS